MCFDSIFNWFLSLLFKAVSCCILGLFSVLYRLLGCTIELLGYCGACFSSVLSWFFGWLFEDFPRNGFTALCVGVILFGITYVCFPEISGRETSTICEKRSALYLQIRKNIYRLYNDMVQMKQEFDHKDVQQLIYFEENCYRHLRGNQSKPLYTSGSDTSERDFSQSEVLEVTPEQLIRLQMMEEGLAATVKESQKELIEDFQEWTQLTELYSHLINSKIKSYGNERDMKLKDIRLDVKLAKYWCWLPRELHKPDVVTNETVDRRDNKNRISGAMGRRDKNWISETVGRRDENKTDKTKNLQTLDITTIVAEKLQILDILSSCIDQGYKLYVLDISGIVTKKLQAVDMVGSKMSEIEKLLILEMTGSDLDKLLQLTFLGSGICEMEKRWSRQAIEIFGLDLNSRMVRALEKLDLMGTEIEEYWTRVALQLKYPDMMESGTSLLKNMKMLKREIEELQRLDIKNSELYACFMWLALRLQKLVSTHSEVSTMEIYWTWQIIRLKKLTVLGLSRQC